MCSVAPNCPATASAHVGSCRNNAQSLAPAFVGLVVLEPFRDVVPGSWIRGCGCLLRVEAYCVLACLPALPLHGVLLLDFAFQVLVRLSRTVCLPSCGRFCSRCPARPQSSRLFFARSWAPALRLIVDFAICCVLDHPTVINARQSE